MPLQYVIQRLWNDGGVVYNGYLRSLPKQNPAMDVFVGLRRSGVALVFASDVWGSHSS